MELANWGILEEFFREFKKVGSNFQIKDRTVLLIHLWVDPKARFIFKVQKRFKRRRMRTLALTNASSICDSLTSSFIFLDMGKTALHSWPFVYRQSALVSRHE